jgi:hypothetical protein
MTKRALTLDAILSDCVAASPHCSGNCCDARTPCRDNLHKRVGQPATGGFPGHDNIADAGLPDDKARREILAAAPFHFNGAVLHRRAKLAFQLFQPALDRGPSVIDQPLGRLAFREIEGWTEFGRSNSNDPRTERSASCAATSNRASFGWPSAKPTITVFYDHRSLRSRPASFLSLRPAWNLRQIKELAISRWPMQRRCSQHLDFRPTWRVKRKHFQGAGLRPGILVSFSPLGNEGQT